MMPILEEAKIQSSSKNRVNLVISDVTPTPMSFGFFKKVIILPSRQYSFKELEYILIHECTHIKNNDSMIKLLTEIFVAIFWWNPFSYLLKKDLSHVLEIKCDQCVLEGKTQKNKTEYFEVLLNQMKTPVRQKAASPVLTTEFAYKQDESRTMQRFNSILMKKQAKPKAIIMNILVFVCAAVLILSTYFVQWRPRYTDGSPTHDEYGNELSNGDNAYVVHKRDGSYEFVFDGYTSPVSPEDVENGMYDSYPIIEEE